MGIHQEKWAAFSQEDQQKIEQTLGIKLADYTTAEQREAVLLEFEMVSRQQAEIQAKKDVMDHYFDRQKNDRQEKSAPQPIQAKALPLAQANFPSAEILLIPAQYSLGTPRTTESPIEILPAAPRLTPGPNQLPTRQPEWPQSAQSFQHALRPRDQIRTSTGCEEQDLEERASCQHQRKAVHQEQEKPLHSFFKITMRYAMVTAFTFGGTYLGFSAARHSDLANELRTMEENPLLRAYHMAHEVETYQKLREWDFLGPKQEEVTQRREILDSAKKKMGKIGKAIDTLKTLVEDIPFLDKGAALIEQQQQQIQLYEQKQAQYASAIIRYTTAGTGTGFGIGVLMAFYLERRRKP